MTDDGFPIWLEYLNNPDAWGENHEPINPEDIRPGCHPFYLIHPAGEERDAIVLLHGLSDSPWFMRAVGWRLHHQAGLNVYAPLLQGHGLKKPNSMQGVSELVWLRNSAWAVHHARTSSPKVSVGGLSTGGAIATLMAFRDQDCEDLADGSPRELHFSSNTESAGGNGGDGATEQVINGGVMLYSAALRLQKKLLIRGRTLESLLRSPVGSILDMVNELMEQPEDGVDPLIGDHPYRYARVDIGAARELAKVINRLDQKRRNGLGGKLRGLQKRLFVSHSDADTTADIRALENLCRATRNNGFGEVKFFRFGKGFQIPHASTVLAEVAFGQSGSPLEPANPFFTAMMAAAMASDVVCPQQSSSK